MKFSRRVQLALLLLVSIALLGCPNNSGNPSTKHMSGAVAIGQCSNYSWKANCQPSNQANFCPSSGNGDCQLSISDNNTTVTATEPGQQDPSYICVTKNTKVDWMEGGSKLFVVAFGAQVRSPIRQRFRVVRPRQIAVSLFPIRQLCPNVISIWFFSAATRAVSSRIPS